MISTISDLDNGDEAAEALGETRGSPDRLWKSFTIDDLSIAACVLELAGALRSSRTSGCEVRNGEPLHPWRA